MKKLVIFDLDGTLLDTIADLAAATNHALKEMGFPEHDMETICSFVGNGVGKLLERALPAEERTDENKQCIRSLFFPYYDEHNTCLSKPYPGVTELLKGLQERGMMLAVASNKYQAATEKLITYYFPEIRLIAVLGQREDVPIKPNPSVINEIMELAKVQREDALYVGDSGVDMQTALNAGVDAVGVSWGFRSREELESFHPLAVIDEAAELLRFM